MTIEDIAHRSSIDLPTGRYRLHPELTTVAFTAKKLGLFTIRGTMTLSSGTFTVASPLERSTLHAVLDAASFRRPWPERDDHVKGPKLLDVAGYPRPRVRLHRRRRPGRRAGRSRVSWGCTATWPWPC